MGDDEPRNPVMASLHGFGHTLAEAARYAITFLAIPIPWGAFLSLLSWLGRKAWRRWKRPPAKA